MLQTLFLLMFKHFC